MGVEICTRCGNRIDLDWNTNGKYIGNPTSIADDYICEDCVIENEKFDLNDSITASKCIVTD